MARVTANGMELETWGSGPRTLLFLQGGPGSAVPGRAWKRLYGRQFSAYVDAGFTVWLVTRRRGMPRGHTVADMADDYAQVIATEIGGHVDLLVGESYGGMVAQHLAARHPGLVDRVALVITGAEVSDWGKDVDRRLAAELRRGDTTAAARVFAEYLLPGDSLRGVRRLLAPLVAGRLVPADDVLVEVEAELAYDSRDVLPLVTAPVLLVCGDRDRFFGWEVVEETAALIPDCTLVRRPGKGHVGVALDRQVARDVVAFADETLSVHEPTGLAADLSYAFPRPHAGQRVVQVLASTRPGARVLARLLPPLDRAIGERTGGRVSLPLLLTGLPVLVLTTTGRRSGLPRRTQLIAVPLGETLALLGTNFGQESTPTWVLNLESDPRAAVTHRGTTREVIARPATEDERAQVMRNAASVYGGYQKYQQRITHRRLRIFVLEPV